MMCYKNSHQRSRKELHGFQALQIASVVTQNSQLSVCQSTMLWRAPVTWGAGWWWSSHGTKGTKGFKTETFICGVQALFPQKYSPHLYSPLQVEGRGLFQLCLIIYFVKLLFHEAFMCSCTLSYICSLAFQQELHVCLGTAIGCEFPFDGRISITEYKKLFF